MASLDYVVVDVNGGFGWVYDFCTPETATEIIRKAEERNAEDIATYESHLVNYPDRAEYWNKMLAKHRKAKYEAMTFEEFLERQRKEMISSEVIETTEEDYEEHLNMLPPLKWCNRDGFSLFCMCEMLTGTYTTQYAKKDGKYYCATVSVTDESTWINNRLTA